MGLRAGLDAMAQVVSRRPLTAEAWVHALVSPCGICGGQVALEQVFYGFPLSVSFRGPPCTRPVGGRSSETVSALRHEQQQKVKIPQQKAKI
jgi:hypothetical protein